MPRIIGVDIPGNKKLEYSLRYIYGVGPAKARDIVKKANIDPSLRANQLTDENVSKITGILQSMMVEGDLRRKVASDIKRLQAIGSYRGMRHKRSLPCHGQRTRTNARTRKGRKQTVGAIRDRVERKLQD